jgi:hypothetical protein
MMQREDGITWGGVLGRFASALVLVHATYNPERFSFYHWAIAPLVRGEGGGGQGALKLIAGVLLLIGWVIFLQATRRSLGITGALLVSVLGGAIIWLLIQWHVLSPSSLTAITHLVLIVLSVVLAVGMSWSIVSRRLSGQMDTDDVGS